MFTYIRLENYRHQIMNFIFTDRKKKITFYWPGFEPATFCLQSRYGTSTLNYISW